MAEDRCSARKRDRETFGFTEERSSILVILISIFSSSNHIKARGIKPACLFSLGRLTW